MKNVIDFKLSIFEEVLQLKYILVMILAILSTIKSGVQSEFSKKSVKNSADALVFNLLVFLFSGMIFSYSIISSDIEVLIYATFGAFFNVLFQLLYTKALSVGNVSLTVMIVNLGIVINVLISYFVYNEPISWIRGVGTILTLITLVICIDFKHPKKAEKKWLVYAICAMLATTSASGVQQIFSKSPYGAQNAAYVSCVYLIGALFIILVYTFLKQKGEGKTFIINKRITFLALTSGICLGLYKFVSTYSLSVVDGTFFFPARSGAIIVFSTLSGVLIFKDKLSINQKISVFLGSIAVVLMNF